MSEPVTVICASTTFQKNPDPGSVKQWCDICADEVWVSPSTLAAMKRWAAENTEVHIRCLPCVAGLISPDDPIGAVREASPEFKARVRVLNKIAENLGANVVVETMTEGET